MIIRAKNCIVAVFRSFDQKKGYAESPLDFENDFMKQARLVLLTAMLKQGRGCDVEIKGINDGMKAVFVTDAVDFKLEEEVGENKC